jgi:hypothetical protein
MAMSPRTPAILRRAQQPLIGSRLGFLRELLNLACRCDFRLLGLAHQLIGLIEAARSERGLRAIDEIARGRILRIKSRDPLHRRFELFGNLDELPRQPFNRDILLPDDLQHGDGGIMGDTKPVAEVDNPICKRANSAGYGGLRQFLYLINGEPIGDRDVASGYYRRTWVPCVSERCSWASAGKARTNTIKSGMAPFLDIHQPSRGSVSGRVFRSKTRIAQRPRLVSL